jgi:hypothetical protein
MERRAKEAYVRLHASCNPYITSQLRIIDDYLGVFDIYRNPWETVDEKLVYASAKFDKTEIEPWELQHDEDWIMGDTVIILEKLS